MTIFRLLHLSDSHFSEIPNRLNIPSLWNQPAILTLSYLRGDRLSIVSPSSFDPDIAEGAARFIFNRKETIDAIAFSGDLATTGRPDDLDVALTYVGARTASFRHGKHPSIGFHQARMIIVPGNHDRYRNAAGMPGSSSFDLKFPLLWNVSKPGVKRRVYGKNGHQLVILAADFTLQTFRDAQPRSPQYWLGQGKVYRDILRQLEQATTQAQEEFKGMPILWMIHFPPISGCDDRLKLLDLDLLLHAAGTLTVPIVISGHLHQNAAYSSRYGTKILCAGAVCSSEEVDNSWLHILDLHTIGSNLQYAEKSDYKWDDEVGDFEQTGPKLCFDQFATST